MRLSKRQLATIFALVTAVICALMLVTRRARAQGVSRPAGDGVFHFTTHIGSFKLLGTQDEPVTGHLDMVAKGTVLVSGVDVQPKTTGTLKLEYSYKPLKKYAYHGQGSLVLDGKWTSVQWFGQDLVGNFKGRGKFRLVGEFDKDLHTGWYWTTDPTKKLYWPANSVMEFLVPGYVNSVTAPRSQPQPVPMPASG